MGIFQIELSRDMGPDLYRRATEACLRQTHNVALLCLRQTGLTALPSVKGKRIADILAVAFIPATNRVVVQN